MISKNSHYVAVLNAIFFKSEKFRININANSKFVRSMFIVYWDVYGSMIRLADALFVYDVEW